MYYDGLTKESNNIRVTPEQWKDELDMDTSRVTSLIYVRRALTSEKDDDATAVTTQSTKHCHKKTHTAASTTDLCSDGSDKRQDSDEPAVPSPEVPQNDADVDGGAHEFEDGMLGDATAATTQQPDGADSEDVTAPKHDKPSPEDTGNVGNADDSQDRMPDEELVHRLCEAAALSLDEEEDGWTKKGEPMVGCIVQDKSDETKRVIVASRLEEEKWLIQYEDGSTDEWDEEEVRQGNATKDVIANLHLTANQKQAKTFEFWCSVLRELDEKCICYMNVKGMLTWNYEKTQLQVRCEGSDEVMIWPAFQKHAQDAWNRYRDGEFTALAKAKFGVTIVPEKHAAAVRATLMRIHGHEKGAKLFMDIKTEDKLQTTLKELKEACPNQAKDMPACKKGCQPAQQMLAAIRQLQNVSSKNTMEASTRPEGEAGDTEAMATAAAATKKAAEDEAAKMKVDKEAAAKTKAGEGEAVTVKPKAGNPNPNRKTKADGPEISEQYNQLDGWRVHQHPNRKYAQKGFKACTPLRPDARVSLNCGAISPHASQGVRFP